MFKSIAIQRGSICGGSIQFWHGIRPHPKLSLVNTCRLDRSVLNPSFRPRIAKRTPTSTPQVARHRNTNKALDVDNNRQHNTIPHLTSALGIRRSPGPYLTAGLPRANYWVADTNLVVLVQASQVSQGRKRANSAASPDSSGFFYFLSASVSNG